MAIPDRVSTYSSRNARCSAAALLDLDLAEQLIADLGPVGGREPEVGDLVAGIEVQHRQRGVGGHGEHVVHLEGST